MVGEEARPTHAFTCSARRDSSSSNDLFSLRDRSSHSAAYHYYLGNQEPYRFDRWEPEAADAIAVIHEAGGLVSLAHPRQLRHANFAHLAHTIKSLADVGLDAVETIYNDHRESFIHELQGLCRKYGLLETGGSDYHGGTKRWITLGHPGGRRRVPRAIYERVVERLTGRPS